MFDGTHKRHWFAVTLYLCVFVALLVVRIANQHDAIRLAVSVLTLLLSFYGWIRVLHWARGYMLAELSIILAGLSTIAVWFFLNWFRVFYYDDGVEHPGSSGATIFWNVDRIQSVLEYLGYALFLSLLVPPAIWLARKLLHRPQQPTTH